MKIKSINIIDGKNKWSESKDKLIHMVLDLGVYENKPSDKIEGFYERIKEYLPSLKNHRCSEGKPGGFLKRIKDGTWMGHIIEHVALELQTLAGMNTGWGRTRGVKGQKGVYNVVFNYEDEDKGKLAAREAFNVVNDIIDNKNPQINNIVKKLKPKTKLQESIKRILREDEELNSDKRVYDYDKERDTVPERLPFDIDKLVDSGVVFVTPAIDGDPNSKTYKKWLEEPYVHLLTLYNVEHSSEDGWIKKAITKVAPTEQYKNFVNKIYDGKYNQILWGLEKLGINPMDMLIDKNLQEHIRKVLREDNKVGKTFWFEYHCYESPESCDAELWYRSHQKVKVIGVSEWSFDEFEDRMDDAQPRVYLVEWEDGFQYDVFEDELMESKDEFYSPDPPIKNLKESIRKVLKEESTQDSLYEIIITENQQDSLKIELQSMVKDIGWELTS